MRIYYPLNPEDAPTAAELAAEVVVRTVLAETDEDGWTLTTEPYDPEDIF